MFVLAFLFQLVLGLLYVNLLEWLIHKHILHGLGKKKGSFFSFHWHRHHSRCRKYGFFDSDYVEPLKWKTTGKEIVGLLLLALLHLPIIFYFPVLYGALFLGAIIYYSSHAISHIHPEIGKKYFPHHFDHHMGSNQDANWCVSYPFWDKILKTRVKYDYDGNWKVIKSKTVHFSDNKKHKD